MKILVILLLVSLVKSQKILRQQTSECNCVSILDCQPYKALLDQRDFQALRSLDRCGFEGTLPKYCCPSPLATTLEPISVSGRFDSENTRAQSTTESISSQVQCGISSDIRIFGGEQVADHQYPWMAALVYENPSKADHVFCAGVLISSNVILTAAHCPETFDGYKLSKARLGHANLKSPLSVNIGIANRIPHPDFLASRTNGFQNDLAILQLDRHLDLSAEITPICLPIVAPSEDELLESNLYVAGWGSTQNSSAGSDVLLDLPLDYITLKDCQEEFAQTEAIINISHLCAKGKLGTDSCRGDSGGPVMKWNNEGFFEVVGILSYGSNQCRSESPGVYTRVDQFLPWISQFLTK